MTAVPFTCAVAVIVVAPEALMLAGVKVTVATPALLVSAVPPTGDMVVKVESVVKVTTVFATAAPVASNSVAVTVPGLAFEMEVVAVPPESAKVSVRFEAAGVVVPPVPDVPDVAVVEPGPHPASKAAVTITKVINLACFKNVVCKTAPSSKNLIRTIANTYERHSITLGFKSATIFLVSWQTG